MNQQQRQTTDAILQLLEQYNLGSFKKKYRTLGWGCFSIVGILFLILTTTVLSSFSMSIMQSWEHLGPESTAYLPGALAIAGFAVFALLLFIGVLLLMYQWIIKGSLNGYLFEYGYVYCYDTGIVKRVVRWADIVAVHHIVRDRGDEHSGASRYREEYAVTLINTEKLFELYCDIEFARSVEQQVADRQYPFARMEYLSGNAVHFGRLDVWQQGLYDTTKRSALLWSEVQSIKLSYSGYVYIKKRGEQRYWASFYIGALHNPEVFRRLIEAEVPYRFEFSLSR